MKNKTMFFSHSLLNISRNVALFCSLLFYFGQMANAQPVTLDPTFGENGIATIPKMQIEFLDFDKSGNIIAVGTSMGTIHEWPLTIVKTNADGIIDLSFGTDGVVKVLEYRIGFPLGLKITNENKILIYGNFYDDPQNQKKILMQFNEDGSVDESFGEHGKIILHLAMGYVANLENDDFMLIGSPTRAISKYNYRGEMDENFGEHGTVTLTDSTTYAIYVHCIKILRDGSIIVAGIDILNRDDTELICIKLDPTGNLITGFANNGVWKMNVMVDPFPDFVEVLRDVVEESNGDLVFVGKAWGGFICSLNSDGILNQDFGTDGFFYYGAPSAYAQQILQNGNKYIIGGDHENIVSVNQDGTLDNFFNNTGSFVCDGGYRFWDWKLQGTNKLILGGNSIARLSIPHNSITSYQKPDDTFIVFPNPAKDYLYFNAERSFEVIDVLGKTVLKSERAMQSINVSHLKAGIYFIKFENRQVRKFVKE
ncbi:MAG: T9SS type A sorting domain-containing protein [Bacteroidetes bacterium]|nr:T9SS type A sorting domain-containing protein [Bacteroidota bacterium]